MSSIICRLTSHKINRNRVWYDGLHNRTNCERCGLAMIRSVSGWRAFDSESDDDPRRTAHPSASPN